MSSSIYLLLAGKSRRMVFRIKQQGEHVLTKDFHVSITSQVVMDEHTPHKSCVPYSTPYHDLSPTNCLLSFAHDVLISDR